MPTYDYQCQVCGHRFEIFQKMTEDPLTTCPECRGSIQRVITGGTGLIFKGSGFYITDYKDGKKGAGTGGAEDKSESKSESKTESKPAESKSSEKTSGSSATDVSK